MAKQEGKSDLKRAFSEDGALKTHVGGQALIEGIMMRGKYNWAVAVREPDGNVYVEEHDLASGQAKNGWMHWPLVRGCRAMVESLMLGYKALEIAALHAFGEEDDEHVEAAESRDELEAVLLDNEFEDEFGDGAAAASDNVAEGVPEGAEETLWTPSSNNSKGKSAAHEGCEAARAAERDVSTTPSGTPSAGEGEAAFSWKHDFGRPDTMIDALGAQRTLEVVTEPAEAPSAEATAAANAEDDGVEFGKREMAVSMIFGLVLGVVLFIVAPAFITNLVVGEYDSNPILWNIVDGLLRVAVFVFYLWLIGRMGEIKRMFGYHGAEHKTIHAYEHGLELTPENARSFPRLHVRCGTAFLIMVMIIAIFVYTVIPLNLLISAWGVPEGAPKLALVILVRILLMPVIAGLAYEITVKWAGSHPDNPLVKVVLWPGMQMQYLTTNEPDDGQIECAIAAMRKVLEREEAEEAKAKASA